MSLFVYRRTHTYRPDRHQEGYNVSKSFSIDLTPFYLCRPIAGTERILQRAIGPYEVSQVLMDLGYSNLNEYSEVLPFRFGVIPSLTDTLTEATLGVPTSAQINVKRMGGKSQRLLLSFIY